METSTRDRPKADGNAMRARGPEANPGQTCNANCQTIVFLMRRIPLLLLWFRGRAYYLLEYIMFNPHVQWMTQVLKTQIHAKLRSVS